MMTVFVDIGKPFVVGMLMSFGGMAVEYVVKLLGRYAIALKYG